MRFLFYALFAAVALADAPDDVGPGCIGPGSGPTDDDPPGGGTGGQDDQVDDPTLPNDFQALQLDHSWLFDHPIAGVVEYEHDPATDTLVLLGLTLDRGATALIDDKVASALTGWPLGSEVDVNDVRMVGGGAAPLDARGQGVVGAGLLLELDLTVVEPHSRGVDGAYHLKVPWDLPLTYDGRTLAFEAVDDGIGGVFTLR